MILKQTDNKTSQLKIVEKLLEESTSDSQKELIKKDYYKLKNGYEAEKENAYLIDFYLKDTKNTIVLHDLRLEYSGLTAQIDHILINRLEILILESKSFKGYLEIKKDNSLEVSYNGKITSYPNPLEQAKRHAEVVKKILIANNIISDGFFSFGYEINSQVAINPNTTVKNETLPELFSKADIFITEWRKRTDNIGLIKAVKLLVGMKSKDEILNIGNFLLSMHKPIEFDYQKKYKIAKKEDTIKKETITKVEKTQDEKIEKPDIETQLKKYRYKVSVSKKIKPYMVFSDKTLSELLTKSPTNLKELEDINGFGPVKVQEYGAAILEILKK